MKTSFTIIAILCILTSCSKESSSPEKNSFDKYKLVGKEWFLGGKSTPQLLTINFKSNDTAYMTKCVWAAVPYQYENQKFPWHAIGKDSIDLSGFHFRVYSLNDTVLVTSNWVVGGISDTARMTFKAY